VTVHLDGARVQPVHSADAFDERRLAGAVVAEQSEHLAAPGVQVDAVQRDDRTEPLGGASHAERERARRAHERAACRIRSRSSSRCRTTSSSTAITMTTPITIG
jgi:hypothetical protein